jgi:transcriptional regulator with XRE-family HTH domain
MAPLRVRLGQAVRELRDAAGFSQEAFAAHVHVHRTSMSSIELGKLNVGLNTLEQLAQGLEMPVWELLRIAEVGAGSAESPRAGRGRRREPPYSGQTVKARNDAAGRRKVAEDRDR